MHSTFYVGQLVRLQPPCGQGPRGQSEGRTYCVTRILSARGEDSSTYLIKNMTGAERIVQPQEIIAASANAVP
jgi:hypothetical protein